MKKAFAVNIKQAIFNRGFLSALIGVILVILLSSMQDLLVAFRSEDMLAYGFHDTLISSTLLSEPMALAL